MTRALRNPLDLTTSLAPLPLPPLLLLRFLLLLVCSTLSDELPVPPSEWRLQFVYTNFMVTSFSSASASASCWPTSSTFLCLSLCPSVCLAPTLLGSCWRVSELSCAELSLRLKPRRNAQIAGCFVTCHAARGATVTATVHDSRLKLCNSWRSCNTERNAWNCDSCGWQTVSVLIY